MAYTVHELARLASAVYQEGLPGSSIVAIRHTPSTFTPTSGRLNFG